MNRSLVVMYLGFVLALATLSSAARAETLTWVGPSNADWLEESHWQPTGVPGNGDSIVVQNNDVLVLDNRSQGLTLSHVSIEGRLVLDNLALEITGVADISGGLSSIGATQIIVSGLSAKLTVEGATRIDDASLYALNGGQIHLNGLTSYVGDGVFEIVGSGSRIVLPNLQRIGIGDAPEPILFESLSREVSVSNLKQAADSDDPLVVIQESLSREVSVSNFELIRENSDPLSLIDESLSREVSVSNFDLIRDDEDPLAVIAESLSREVSVSNYRQAQGNEDPLPILMDALSREVSVDNESPE